MVSRIQYLAERIMAQGPGRPFGWLDWIGDNSAPLNRIAESRNDEANYVVAGWS